MSNNIKVTQTLNDKQFIQELAKQQREIAKLLTKFEQVASAGNRAGKMTQQSFSGALRTVSQFSGALTGVGGIVGGIVASINQMKREYENIKNRQANAGRTTVSYQDALTQALGTMGGSFSAKEIDQFARQMVEKSNYQIDQTKAVLTMEQAYSSRGASNRQEAMDALSAAFDTMLIAPHLSTEETGDIAAQVTNLMNRYGFSSKQSIGYLLNLKEKSNITSFAELNKNVVPSIINAENYGLTPAQTAALAAVISQGLGDVTGEVTATTLVNFLQSLKERFREGDGSFNYERAMRQLQSDPELTRNFFEGGIVNDGKTYGEAQIGRGKAQPVLESLLNPNHVLARQLELFESQIGGAEVGEQTFRRYYKQIQEVTPHAQTQRAFANRSQINELNNPEEAFAGITREGLRQFLKSAGISDFEQWTSEIHADMQTMGIRTPKQTIEYLKKRADRIQNPAAPTYDGMGIDFPLTEQQKRLMDALNDMAASLGKIYPSAAPAPVDPAWSVDQRILEKRWAESGVKDYAMPKAPPGNRFYQTPQVDPSQQMLEEQRKTNQMLSNSNKLLSNVVENQKRPTSGPRTPTKPPATSLSRGNRP